MSDTNNLFSDHLTRKKDLFFFVEAPLFCTVDIFGQTKNKLQQWNEII